MLKKKKFYDTATRPLDLDVRLVLDGVVDAVELAHLEQPEKTIWDRESFVKGKDKYN